MSEPTLKIVYRDLDKLIPYARNSRTHDDAQVAQIAASMVEFGWTMPVLTDGENGIIAGHGRVLAARKVWDAGKTISNCPRGKVPCIDAGHMSEDQKRAYVIADNKLALNAGWDMPTLKEELLALDHANYDLALTGFGEDEIKDMMEWAPGPGADKDSNAAAAGDNYTEQYGVIIVCSDEAEQQRVYEKLSAEGYNAKVVVT
jgi:ParB-like chromosome segregation protein Spo0J